jgi:hypothetical protein
MTIKNDVQLLLLKSIAADGFTVLRREIYGANLIDLVDGEYLAERVINENKSEYTTTDQGRRALKEAMADKNWRPKT